MFTSDKLLNPPTPRSLHCHECEAHAEPEPGKILPEGWGFLWAPDDADGGKLGPFYGCPTHLDPNFYGADVWH